MADITIPPAALEAAARALKDHPLVPFTEDAALVIARASIAAAINAWPGMCTGPNIYGRRDAVMHLPLPQESTNAET